MTIGGHAGWQLSGLLAVVSALLTMSDAEAILGWLRGLNPYRGDRRPLDVIAAGYVASVRWASVQPARTHSFA